MFSRDDMLNMVFTTAFEGGINYWAAITHYKWSDGEPDYNMIPDFEGRILDLEDDEKKYVVNADVIRRGIRLAWQNQSKFGEPYQRQALSDLHYGKWDDVDFDADTADFIVQYGLFGKVVYG